MTDHVNLSDAELHEPKGMQLLTGGAADVGKVICSDGNGKSSPRRLSLTDLAESINLVYVSEESDLPAIVGGRIPLATRTTYIFTNDVTLSAPLSYDNEVLIDGIQSGQVTISYAGILPFIVNANDDCDLRVQNVTIDVPSAPLCGQSATGASAGDVRFENSVISAASFGTLDNIAIFQMNQIELLLSTTGMTFTGAFTTPVINITNMLCNLGAGDFMDITAVTVAGGRMEFSQIIEVTPSRGIVSNGQSDITAGSIFEVRTCLLSVTTPLAGGVSVTSGRWNFRDALPLQDTQLGATAYLDVARTVPISVIGQFEQILGGNWSEVLFTENISVSADGIVTYIGERPIAVSVVATATVEKVGSGADVVAVRLAQNGVTIAYTEGRTQNPTSTQVTCTALLQLQPNDTFELQVANATTTSDIIVNLANITGTRVS